MNRLKELRKQKGLTLDVIAQETGVKRGTYNNYENGKTNPKPETWEKLAKYFDVPIPYLQGQGWSKDRAIESLAIVYSSYKMIDFCSDYDYDDVEYNCYFDYKYDDIEGTLYEDENCEDGIVFELSKKVIENLDDNSYLSLKTAYSLGITNKDSTDWLVFGNEKFPCVDSFSDIERIEIKDELTENSKNINVYELLNFVFSDDEIDELEKKSANFFKKIIEGNISELEKDKYLISFKKIANKYFSKILNDYNFLSTIEENQYKNGIAGSYELAKKVQSYVQIILARNVFSNSQELSRKALAAYLKPIKSNEVKESLTDLFEEILGELYDLREQVDSIQYRLDNPKDYDNNSFDD